MNHPCRKFAKQSNIMHTKNHLKKQRQLKKPLRPSLVILQFSKILLKASAIVFLIFSDLQNSLFLPQLDLSTWVEVNPDEYVDPPENSPIPSSTGT